MPEIIQVRDTLIPRGVRARIELDVARLPTGTWLSLPMEVVHGTNPGPHLWLSGAVHGDEINGVEIIRRVLARLDPQQLFGAVFAVPIVNVFGFVDQSRYLPDRRDLNRCFPGSSSGSLASRMAHLFMTEVVSRCSYGIDLHTGSNHRTNLPQIRANLEDPETRRIAEAFQAPVMMHSQVRDGSLRQAATQLGIHVLLYEAGEPLRFDRAGIELGVKGVLRVLAALGMRKRKNPSGIKRPSIEVRNTSWVRAKQSGILRLECKSGDIVQDRQILGLIADAFGDNPVHVRAPFTGMVLGHTNNPLVNQGDAVVHMADCSLPPSEIPESAE